HDAFLAQREPWRTARGRGAGEGGLVGLRVAPAQPARAAVEGAAVDEAAGEVGGQRLAVVRRGPGHVTAVEGVLAGNRGLRASRRGIRAPTRAGTRPGARLDVDQGLALGEVLARVDVEVVAPEDVLVGGVARAARREVAGVAREAQGAVVHRVDGHVAAGDVVAQGAAGATAAEDRRSLTGQRKLQVGDELRRQRRWRQLAVAAREVDVL